MISIISIIITSAAGARVGGGVSALNVYVRIYVYIKCSALSIVCTRIRDCWCGRVMFSVCDVCALSFEQKKNKHLISMQHIDLARQIERESEPESVISHTVFPWLYTFVAVS